MITCLGDGVEILEIVPSRRAMREKASCSSRGEQELDDCRFSKGGILRRKVPSAIQKYPQTMTN